jgi:hypothetical protein
MEDPAADLEHALRALAIALEAAGLLPGKNDVLALIEGASLPIPATTLFNILKTNDALVYSAKAPKGYSLVPGEGGIDSLVALIQAKLPSPAGRVKKKSTRKTSTKKSTKKTSTKKSTKKTSTKKSTKKASTKKSTKKTSTKKSTQKGGAASPTGPVGLVTAPTPEAVEHEDVVLAPKKRRPTLILDEVEVEIAPPVSVTGPSGDPRSADRRRLAPYLFGRLTNEGVRAMNMGLLEIDELPLKKVDEYLQHLASHRMMFDAQFSQEAIFLEEMDERIAHFQKRSTALGDEERRRGLAVFVNEPLSKGKFDKYLRRLDEGRYSLEETADQVLKKVWKKASRLPVTEVMVWKYIKEVLQERAIRRAADRYVSRPALSG